MARAKKITKKDLQQIGYWHLELIKAAGKTAKKLQNQEKLPKQEVLDLLQKVLENPEAFAEDLRFEVLRQKLSRYAEDNQALQNVGQLHTLKETPENYPIYGKSNIESGAIAQMDTAMSLPISVAGALMPDAHYGYGLPIGGVLATEADKVIPFAVGVDIACRMCLSVFELEAQYLDKNQNKLKNLLQKNTCFGTGKGFDRPLADEVFDHPDWQATKVIRGLRQKAIRQIGSSGTGNHFVEWGIVEVQESGNALQLPAGSYLALLSHSGSRGFGAGIAGHYSKLAMELCKLPKEAEHLAWLDLNQEAGQEYWIAMNLAGAYASANHHQIHRKMANDLGLKPLKIIENHHNFAWKEQLANGREVIIHRKGATPAKAGELGIIPGSMTSPGFVVEGKGLPESLYSASHGAGRQMSRRKARAQVSKEDLQRVLTENRVSLIGGDLDEAPMAYKDINQVIAFQQDLIKVLAKFSPRIVRMADHENRRPRRRKSGLSFEES